MDTTIPMDTNQATDTTTERPVRDYFSRVKRLLLSPSRFFREDLPQLSLSEALAFGIVSAWLASLLAFAFDTMNSLLISRLFESWVQRLLATESGLGLMGLSGKSFLWAAGLLVLGPFLFLLRIFIGSAVIYLFSLLLVEERETAPEPVSFKGVLRIRASAFASQWFVVVPVFGALIAFIADLVLLITGVRERFQVSTRRASVIILAPYFFLLVGLMLLGVLMLLVLSQIPFGDFLQFDKTGGLPFPPQP